MDKEKTKRITTALIIILLLLLLLLLLYGAKARGMFHERLSTIAAEAKPEIKPAIQPDPQLNHVTTAIMATPPPPPPVVHPGPVLAANTIDPNLVSPKCSCICNQNKPKHVRVVATKKVAPVVTKPVMAVQAKPTPRPKPKLVAATPHKKPVYKDGLPFTPVSKKWYAEFELAYYSLNLPTHFIPLTMGNWSELGPPPPTTLSPGIQLDRPGFMPEITIGYHLDKVQLLPARFGKESIELSYSQFYSSESAVHNFSGAPGVDAGAAYGVIWKINQNNVPLYGGGAERIVSTSLHGKTQYNNGVFDFKTEMSSHPSKYMCTPSVGVVFTSLNQNYYYNINATTQGVTHLPINTIGDDGLLARYMGIALGDRLEWNFTPQWSWFVDGKVHLLRAYTTLISNQIPDAATNPAGGFSDYLNNIRVTARDTRGTYRALVSAGVKLYMTGVADPNSVQLTIFGGVDQWGFVPQEATITSLNAPGPHIVPHSMRNYFGSIGLLLPIV